MNMNFKIKAIFFDIGGTLVLKGQKSQLSEDSIQKMMRLLGDWGSADVFLSLLKANEARYKEWRGKTLTELSLKDRWLCFLGDRYPRDVILEHYEELQQLWGSARGPKTINPDTVSTLKELSKRGYLLGTISHSSPKYLDGTGVLELMTTSIHAVKFGRRKPHPSLFLAAARECGVRPEECAYVGDRPSRDVIGSREAGIGEVVLIASEEGQSETVSVPMSPDHSINRLSELLDLFPGVEVEKAEKVPETYFLYDAAISTMWGIKEGVPLADFFVNGRDLGFARFELNHNIPPQNFEQLDQNLYHVGSVHNPCPAFLSTAELDRRDWLMTSLDESLRIKGVDVVKRTIEKTVHLCANNVVIHAGRVTGDHSMDEEMRKLYKAGKKGSSEYEELRQRLISDRLERGKPHLASLIKSISELVEFARPTGISLGFENMFYYYELPVIEEMQVLLDTFTESWVGWHLDVGHAQVHDNLGLASFSEWLERFSKRIIGVHLHDVKGILDHQSPGSGEVDFNRVAGHLPRFAHRTLEVNPKLSAQEIRSGMETLVAAGCVSRI